ncbi:2-methylisocitrate lyase-like PEP mutase family enzyme [Stackebrandtia albiflava]|uniref:2-methylisocitrate lyase-like PEP mutase family enzyme n=1 Tax=Stackebrandtia albiflava TaxID=406432 RepID=A0A562VET1_9ACTN|nr:isocitrate lyase/phosphoenolpyruvate mutase family protein [Stackebrandtia albiflava]TWJ16382.1 2-methylisocitrate lyase-like PEP mutase family enzyme [Stackebrandtia albiflava]
MRDFHALHHGAVPLLLPNAWDFASAAVLVEARFEAVGTTSLGVAAAAGVPDGAGVTREHTVALARSLVRLPVPVTVDVEGGFGEDAEEVADFVAYLAGLGVAGVNIEDGRPGGVLVEAERHAAVVSAVKRRSPDLFVNARTDGFWCGVEDPLESGLERAARYVRAGADGVFVPGAVTAADVAALVAGVAAPLNVLFSPEGPDVAELTGLGVARVSTGSLLFRSALRAVVGTATAVRDGGAVVGAPGYGEVQDLVAGLG